ncbi:Aste57867_3143 [Aphanomyces stellatus]|uniref:Aste57867_3143 protein n=1 Tax=Aphanomyces stellatus TaxID=120398 RepID=A0A485KBI7_9STRA|nr:hypothetical protein As57867_003134 [Aphanomyces stellatus]VFT80318.1 Aste57867_3143 [Aphanomyces stellatus]
MQHVDPLLLDTDEMKKFFECMRLRKYRADRKAVKQKLLQDVQRLEAELARLQLCSRKAKATKVPATALLDHNKSLRAHVDHQGRVARLLAAWVASHYLPERMPTRAGWIESTLVANPLTRRQGLQWLSDRVYHIAMQSVSRHPIGPSMADGVRAHVHLQDENSDDDDGLQIGGSEAHIQHTFFANVQDVANVIWSWDQCNCAYGSEVTEVVDNTLVYYRGNTFSGVSLRRVNRMYNEGHRVVFTQALVAEDECYAVADDELRIHGFVWNVIERVTDSVTRVRLSRYHAPPKTKHRLASVEEVAKLYMRPTDCDTLSRLVLAQRLRETVENMYNHVSNDFVRSMAKILDEQGQV